MCQPRWQCPRQDGCPTGLVDLTWPLTWPFTNQNQAARMAHRCITRKPWGAAAHLLGDAWLLWSVAFTLPADERLLCSKTFPQKPRPAHERVVQAAASRTWICCWHSPSHLMPKKVAAAQPQAIKAALNTASTCCLSSIAEGRTRASKGAADTLVQPAGPACSQVNYVVCIGLPREARRPVVLHAGCVRQLVTVGVQEVRPTCAS